MIRLGILGCARIVRRDLTGGASLSKRTKIEAIASRNQQTASAWAKEFEIPHVHDSYDALLTNPNVDAVYLPLPNELHLPWVTKCAEAGKHILCEKPLALDADQAEQMVHVCEKHHVILMEAFMWRHHPRASRAKKLVNDNHIGQLRQIKFDFSFPMEQTDIEWRLDPTRGGGALFDLGCYGINIARFFTDAEPMDIKALAHLGTSGVDLTSTILMRFPNEVLASLDCSFEAPNRNRLEIIGTEGTLELLNAVLPTEGEHITITKDGRQTEIPIEPANQYALELDAFAEGITTGKLPAPAENGLLNMKVLSEVRGLLRF